LIASSAITPVFATAAGRGGVGHIHDASQPHQANPQVLWNETLGDPRITVAVLDGPVDLTHTSLAGAELSLVPTLASTDTGRETALAHGTLVASLIFGRHDRGVLGIAPACRGLIVPIFRDGDNGQVLPCSQIDLARAITAAAEAGANIINVSGGEFSPSGAAYPLLNDIVKKYARRGILIVAAAGNDGCECLHIPAALADTLAVGAIDSQGRPLASSNWGAQYRANGILAPGTELAGAKLGGGAIAAAGSSIATAYVSGIAALLMSLDWLAGRKPDGARIRDALLRSSDPCLSDGNTCRRWLYGRLNVPNARAFLTRGVTPMTQDNPLSESVTPSSALPLSESEPAVPRGAPVTASVLPSACACGAAPVAPGRVFAIGQLGYDFGTEARQDSIYGHTDGKAANPRDLLSYFDEHPAEAHLAQAITWTLNFDQTPIYAIYPTGPFASEVYARLRGFLRDQISDDVSQQAERVSIAGVVAGSVRLLNGKSVPVILPDLRGMYNWRTKLLIEKALGARPETGPELSAYDRGVDILHNFLERVYHEHRNLGATADERALNFAATNALQAGDGVKDAVKHGFELESFDVERSAHCRPESDCWDVKINFFDPAAPLHTVRRVCRFTVDVSDVVPVMVAPVRHWTVRTPASRR
jgi:hypothetical protein